MTKDQLQKYFYDQCSAIQAQEVEQWIANIIDGSVDDSLFRELLEEIRIDKDERLVNKAFKKFEKTILLREKQKLGKKIFMQNLGRIYRVAAAILFIPLLIATFYFYQEKNSPKEWVEEYVPYGQRKMVHLPDNTKIWLNSGTTLIYPKKFNNSIRQVYFTGEAYAEVSHDRSRPFVMSTSEVSVEVLGTKFNVKSYSEDSQITVSLIEGSVRMNADYKGTRKTKLLKPGESVKFSKQTGELKKSEFMIPNMNQWYNGKGFYFIDESLSEITVALERHFNVRINIENESLKKERFYSIFVNDESLDDILTALNVNGKMKIMRNTNLIYIY